MLIFKINDKFLSMVLNMHFTSYIYYTLYIWSNDALKFWNIKITTKVNNLVISFLYGNRLSIGWTPVLTLQVHVKNLTKLELVSEHICCLSKLFVEKPEYKVSWHCPFNLTEIYLCESCTTSSDLDSERTK